MLVLSGVFNTRTLDAMNYVNQDYMHVNYSLPVDFEMVPNAINVPYHNFTIFF
jgi:hypothetical protein